MNQDLLGTAFNSVTGLVPTGTPDNSGECILHSFRPWLTVGGGALLLDALYIKLASLLSLGSKIELMHTCMIHQTGLFF